MSATQYSTATLWGIHGGRTGDADGIFLKKNQVALGWDAMGDLAALAGHEVAPAPGDDETVSYVAEA